jgi:hypothetical protein
MAFGHHKTKLAEIEAVINQGEYAAAKRIIAEHIENEAKGRATLGELGQCIGRYEEALNKITENINELTDRDVPNRMFFRDQCKGNITIARQQLKRINEIMVETEKDFKE